MNVKTSFFVKVHFVLAIQFVLTLAFDKTVLYEKFALAIVVFLTKTRYYSFLKKVLVFWKKLFQF